MSSCEYQAGRIITEGRKVQFNFTCRRVLSEMFSEHRDPWNIDIHVRLRVPRCTYNKKSILDVKLVSMFLFSNKKLSYLISDFFTLYIFKLLRTSNVFEKCKRSPSGVRNISAYTRLPRNLQRYPHTPFALFATESSLYLFHRFLMACTVCSTPGTLVVAAPS